MKAFEVASQQPWLIRAEVLDTILDICSRENVITAEVLDKISARRDALATRAGSRMDGTRYTQRRDGVAVIDVTGTIMRRADLFMEISGGTATGHLATDFQAALDDPKVRAIVLNIDSPGGEATGIHELANQIFNARGRLNADGSPKSIVAYAEGFAASAAYWIASAADEIVTDATAMLGSIGVVFSVPDPNAEKQRRIDIVSNQSPKKRPNVATEEGQSQLQRWANELADVFIASVARNRCVDVETVLADFGQGDLRIGQDAVDHGMADRVGSLESVIEGLASGSYRPTARSGGSDNNQTTGGNMEKEKAAPAAEKQNPAGAVTLTAEEIAAIQRENAQLKEDKAKSDELAASAVKEKLSIAANAKVDAWLHEGRISGNATEKVRSFYLALATGEKVTTEQFEGVVAALPQFDTKRVAADVKPSSQQPEPAVSLEDFKKAAFDNAAAGRIMAVVEHRKANGSPKFTSRDLEAELATAAAKK